VAAVPPYAACCAPPSELHCCDSCKPLPALTFPPPRAAVTQPLPKTIKSSRWRAMQAYQHSVMTPGNLLWALKSCCRCCCVLAAQEGTYCPALTVWQGTDASSRGPPASDCTHRTDVPNGTPGAGSRASEPHSSTCTGVWEACTRHWQWQPLTGDGGAGASHRAPAARCRAGGADIAGSAGGRRQRCRQILLAGLRSWWARSGGCLGGWWESVARYCQRQQQKGRRSAPSHMNTRCARVVLLIPEMHMLTKSFQAVVSCCLNCSKWCNRRSERVLTSITCRCRASVCWVLHLV